MGLGLWRGRRHPKPSPNPNPIPNPNLHVGAPACTTVRGELARVLLSAEASALGAARSGARSGALSGGRVVERRRERLALAVLTWYGQG